MQYRARQMRQNSFRMPTFTEKMRELQAAEAALRRCIALDPTDARAYVALGKQLQLELRFEEAGKVYDDGIAVTGVTSPHLPWFCMPCLPWLCMSCRDSVGRIQETKLGWGGAGRGGAWRTQK